MRTIPRHLVRFAAFTSVIACVSLPELASAAKKTCTNSWLNGSYVLSIGGFITPAPPPQFQLGVYSPVAIVGTFTFDGKGHAARSLMVNAAGQPFHVSDSGAYQLNPDCSGTASFTTNNETFSFSLIDDEMLSIVSTTPGESGSGTLTKQDIAHCNSHTLRGVHIFNGNGLGTFQNPPQTADAFFPVAISGTWTFDGEGIVSRSLALSFAGYPGPYDDSGSYQVNSDCTALVYFPSDTETFQLIVIDEKRAVFGVAALGRLGTGTLIKQQLPIRD